MRFVSAVLPTRGRQELAAQAVECFKSQTYLMKELVVLDDEDDPSFPDGIQDVRIHYFRQSESLNIPQKRNKVNALTRGEVLMHFDSDDWSAPERMADQMRLFEECGKAVLGFHSVLFHASAAAYRYVGATVYPLGTSLCYRKCWWSVNPFDEKLKTGEDKAFADVAIKAGEFVSVPGNSLIVARIHEGNTASKNPDRGVGYARIDPSELPEGFLVNA